MKNSSLLILAALAAAPLSANAVIVSGWGTSSSVSTIESCPSYCTGFGGGYAEDGNNEGGSLSTSVAYSDVYGSAEASASITGTGYIPTLRAGATAGATSGAFASAFAVQGFTYTGTEDTTLTLNVNLHGINSSDDADIRADIAILRGSEIYFYPDFGTQVSEASYPSELETVESIFMSGVGESILSLALDINLSAGDDFFIVSSLEARGLRGASADALNTLTMEFNDDSQLQAASVSAVPVPAAVWLFGSGLVGLMAVARRKKA